MGLLNVKDAEQQAHDKRIAAVFTIEQKEHPG